MMTLPPDTLALLNRRVQTPTYLIEIELGALYLLSTRGDYADEEGDPKWEGGKVVGELQIDQDSAAFGIVNEDYRFTTPALSGTYHRAPVRIWWADGAEYLPLLIDTGYVADGYYDEGHRLDPILVFDGHVSEFDQISTVLGVVAQRSAARRYPSTRALPPIVNYARPEGSVVVLGGTPFRLEPRPDND